MGYLHFLRCWRVEGWTQTCNNLPMDTNVQQSPSGHKRTTISVGVRVLNFVMVISTGARIIKVVMAISAGTIVLKAVMAISRLLGIKLHKRWTNFVKHQPPMWSLLSCLFLIKIGLTQSFILLIICNYCIWYFSNIISFPNKLWKTICERSKALESLTIKV